MIVVVNPSNSNGHSFKGLHAYCAHDTDRAQTSERVDWIDTRNIGANDPSQAWKIMAATAAAQNDLKRASGIRAGRAPKDGAVTHVVLSFAKGEPTDRESLQAAADGFLAQFGVDPARQRSKTKRKERQFADEHQVVMYAHTDTDNTHVHLMINRVHPQTGRLLPDNNNFDKAQKWALEYSKKHGTDHLTPARQENRDMRENGEYVKGERRKSRNMYELEKTISRTANDNDRVASVKDQQRRKDANLSLRGRNLQKLQAAELDKLVDGHKQRKAALGRDLQRKINKARSAIREEYRPKWRELQKVQRSERQTFAELEKSFFGRASNIVKTVKLSADLMRHGESGIIARSFRILSNAGARREYFDKAQERARKALQREQADKLSLRTKSLKDAQAGKYAQNRAVFFESRAQLFNKQVLQSKELQDAWQQRTADRKKAYADLSAELSARNKLDADSRRSASRDMSPATRALLDSYLKDDFKKVRQEKAPEQDNTPNRNKDDDRER